MPMNTMTDFFPFLLQELHDAELQLVAAIPTMAGRASSGMLRAALEEHLQETKVHVQRLEYALDQLGVGFVGIECRPIAALIAAGDELVSAIADPDVADAAIVGAAQRVEHFEIAAYATVAEMAYLLGRSEISALLHKTLDEETLADSKLLKAATLEVNPRAVVWHASSR